jgi:hypothetical protein
MVPAKESATVMKSLVMSRVNEMVHPAIKLW